MKRPELAVPLGLTVGLVSIVGAALLEGIRLSFLLQPTAALIVIGGTVGAVIVRRGVDGLRQAMRAVTNSCVKKTNDDIEITKARLAWLAKLARREGAPALEAQATKISDPLISEGLMMASQYSEAGLVRAHLARILDFEDEQGLREAITIEGAASYAPTFGILGAVLGLIQVLRSLADPSLLGVGIATAFVATIYGVGLANLVLFPLAARLREQHAEHMRLREAIAEALIAVAAHETPGIIARKFAAEIELFAHQEKV